MEDIITQEELDSFFKTCIKQISEALLQVDSPIEVGLLYDEEERKIFCQTIANTVEFIKFLDREKLGRDHPTDFIRVKGDVYFGLNMFSFYDEKLKMKKLHHNAHFLLFINDFILKIKHKNYFPISLINIICNDLFNKELYNKFTVEKTKTYFNISYQKTYLMFDKNTGYYKIGKSKKPEFRERTLQSEKPTIILLFYCNENIEKILHDKYEDNRVRGEWFNLKEDDVLDIYDIMRVKEGFTVCSKKLELK